MKWEWADTTSVALVAIVAMVLQWLGGERQRNFDREMARIDRHQRRLQDAYADALAFAARVGYWVSMVQPMVGPTTLPPLPELVEQAGVEGWLRAFGSTEVLDCWERWLAVVIDIAKDDYLLRLYVAARDRREDSGIDHAEIWGRLNNEHKPAELARRKELNNRVAQELGSRGRQP
jgi:hypothetical protein